MKFSTLLMNYLNVTSFLVISVLTAHCGATLALVSGVVSCRIFSCDEVHVYEITNTLRFFSPLSKTHFSVDLSIGSLALYLVYLNSQCYRERQNNMNPNKNANMNMNLHHMIPVGRLTQQIERRTFWSLTRMSWAEMLPLGIEGAVQYFTAFVIDAIWKCIPRANAVAYICCVPWRCTKCRKARKRPIEAWGLLREAPLLKVLLMLNRKNHNAAERADNYKKENFLTGIHSYTHQAKIWNKGNNVKRRETPSPLLVNTQIDTLEDQANFLGTYSNLLQWIRPRFRPYSIRNVERPTPRKNNKRNQILSPPCNMVFQRDTYLVERSSRNSYFQTGQRAILRHKLQT